MKSALYSVQSFLVFLIVSYKTIFVSLRLPAALYLFMCAKLSSVSHFVRLFVSLAAQREAGGADHSHALQRLIRAAPSTSVLSASAMHAHTRDFCAFSRSAQVVCRFINRCLSIMSSTLCNQPLCSSKLSSGFSLYKACFVSLPLRGPRRKPGASSYTLTFCLLPV